MPDRPKTVVDALLDDLQQLGVLIDQHGPTPFLVRVYARTIFSVFDGYAYFLKQNAVKRAEAEGVSLSKDELEMIYERRGGDPARGGKPKTVSTAENLRFAMKLWARVNGGEAPPRDAQLPPEFERIRVLRNAITHPKRIEDFDVFPY